MKRRRGCQRHSVRFKHRITGDSIFFLSESPEGKEVLSIRLRSSRTSSLKISWVGNASSTIGPAIDQGFYYDLLDFNYFRWKIS